MRKDDCYILGKITKTTGIKGAVFIFLDTDRPEAYQNLESVLLEFNHELIPFFLENFQLRSDTKAAVKFSDIDTEEAARELVNKEVFIPLNKLPKLEPHQYYYHEVEGFSVVDQHGKKLGIIDKILDNQSNELVAVKNESRELLIPHNDSYIKSVDKTQQVMHVNLPFGFEEAFSNPI
ncbi:MAG: ribosome maturation factor RimM [Luteibaculum sp.]